MPTLISGGTLRARSIAHRSGATSLDFEGGTLPGGVHRRAAGQCERRQHRRQLVLRQRTPCRNHAQRIIRSNAGLDRRQLAPHLIADAGEQGRKVFDAAISTGWSAGLSV